MEFKRLKYVKYWIGENKEDRIGLLISYFGGLTCPVFVYLYSLILNYFGKIFSGG